MNIRLLSAIFFCFSLPITSMEMPVSREQEFLQAVANNDIAKVELLLFLGVNPNFFSRQDRGDFSLAIAAVNGYADMVSFLLNVNVDPALDENILCKAYSIRPQLNENPYMFFQRRDKLLKLLISHPRTNLNCKLWDGTTPLIKATQMGDFGQVYALISTGRVNAMAVDSFNKIALQYARDPNIQNVLKYFSQPTATPKRKVPEEPSPAPKKAKERKKETYYSSKEMLKNIPGYSETAFTQEPAPSVAQPQPVSRMKSIPERFSAAISSNDVNAIRQLLMAGNDVNTIVNAKSGQTVLMQAASINALPVVNELLTNGSINPNQKNIEGETALMIATRIGAGEVVYRLLQDPRVRENINLENNQGLTAFDIANEKQYGPWLPIGKMLLDVGGGIGSSAERKPISKPQIERPAISNAAYARLSSTLTRESMPLEILGFKKEDIPTQDQIRKAYRMLSLKWHPDKNPGDPEAADVFKLVSWAYNALTQTQ